MARPEHGSEIHKNDYIRGVSDDLQDTAALPEDPTRVEGPGNGTHDSPVAHGQVEGE